MERRVTQLHAVSVYHEHWHGTHSAQLCSYPDGPHTTISAWNEIQYARCGSGGSQPMVWLVRVTFSIILGSFYTLKRHHYDHFIACIHPITLTLRVQSFWSRWCLHSHPWLPPGDPATQYLCTPPYWRSRLVRFSCRYIQSRRICVDADIYSPLSVICDIDVHHRIAFTRSRTALIMAR